jgi:hypothetical protein
MRKDETQRLNKHIRREDFKAGEHMGVKLRLGRPRAALQTKAMPRVASGAGAGGYGGSREKEAVESQRRNSDGFIHNVGTPCTLT